MLPNTLRWIGCYIRITFEQLFFLLSKLADVAQLVEQSIRNRQVIGSSPIVGSSF
jgi:hypothetical protein